MRASTVLAHIATRTGVAVWRHRTTWLLCTVVVAGLAVYEVGFAGPTTAGANNDCADTTMAAVAKIDDDAARAAYHCLGDAMKRSGEQQFVETLHQRGDLPDGKVSRVGDHRTIDGGRIVFFTVEAGGQSVGYIVYMNKSGLVDKIE